MIAEGTYPAIAKSAELGFTKGNEPQIGVTFVLLDDQGAETPDRIVWFGYFTEKTERRTLESLRHCGWVGNDVTDLQGLGSQPVELVIEHEVFEGKTQVKVQWVNQPGGGAFKMARPMDDAAKRQFAARMKSLAASVPTSGGGKPAPQATKPAGQAPHPNAPGANDGWGPPPNGSDDLPF